MEFLLQAGGSILLLMIIVPLVWWVGQCLFNVIWMFFPFKVWRITDVSHHNIPLPDEIADNQFNVEMLDFLPAGVFEVQLTPFAKTGQYTRLFTAENYEAYAEVTQISSMNLVGFFTLFPDNALIMTTYPYGENIQTPMFHQRYAANSLDAAYYHHMKQVERWRELHGTPVLLRNPAEIHAADAIYRQLHRRRHYHRLMAQQLTMALAFLALFPAGLLWFLPNSIFYDENSIFLSVPALILSLVLFFGLNVLAQRLLQFPESVDESKKADDVFTRDL
jgi:hypothetical protein